MQTVELTQGHKALVDDKDFERVSAALAYDNAAHEHFGEFADTNFAQVAQ